MTDYSTQLNRIQDSIEQEDGLYDDIDGGIEHVRGDVTYRRDEDGIDITFATESDIDQEAFEDMLSEQYSPPHSKRYRMEEEDDHYTVSTIYDNSFDVWNDDGDIRLHFDIADEDWAIEEGQRIARLLDE